MSDFARCMVGWTPCCQGFITAAHCTLSHGPVTVSFCALPANLVVLARHCCTRLVNCSSSEKPDGNWSDALMQHCCTHDNDLKSVQVHDSYNFIWMKEVGQYEGGRAICAGFPPGMMMPGALGMPSNGPVPAGMSGPMFGGGFNSTEGNGFAHPSSFDTADFPAGINVEEARSGPH